MKITTYKNKIALYKTNRVKRYVSIGDYYEGGYIVYIFQPGDTGYVANEFHGLVCSITDIGQVNWGPTNNNVIGTSLNLGTGQSNTTKMITTFGSSTSYAAGLCDAYSHDGYSDWYLPSGAEVSKFFAVTLIDKHYNSGFGGYWSSSQNDLNSAWKITGPPGYTGPLNYVLKNSNLYVRAFRTF